jgi:Cd2+/Zn2+-exporting ATPase
VKALFVVLTFAGMASLWGAIAADVGASLLVVANALRLLRVAPLSFAKSKGFDQAAEAMAVGRITRVH